MILVDANILMYAAGAEHPHKLPSLDFLERVADGKIEAALDVEVLQEILHRYRALRRWEDGSRVFDLARQIFRCIYTVEVDTLVRAKSLLDLYPTLMARDGLHAAVVQLKALTGVCSYDSDFDVIPGINRKPPHLWQ